MDEGWDMLKIAIDGNADVAETSLWQMINRIPMWVQVCAPDSTIMMVNRAATQISGYDAADMLGQKWPYPWICGEWFPENRANGQSANSWPSVDVFGEFYGDDNNPPWEVGYVDRQGNSKFLALTLTPVPIGADQSDHLMMVARDLTDQKIREAELAQAQKIQLMGIPEKNFAAKKKTQLR